MHCIAKSLRTIGVMVRASALQLVDLGFVSPVKSYQKTAIVLYMGIVKQPTIYSYGSKDPFYKNNFVPEK